MLCRLTDLWDCFRVGRRDPAARAATKTSVHAPQPVPNLSTKTRWDSILEDCRTPFLKELARPLPIEGSCSELSQLHSFDREDSTIDSEGWEVGATNRCCKVKHIAPSDDQDTRRTTSENRTTMNKLVKTWHLMKESDGQADGAIACSGTAEIPLQLF